MKSQTCKTVRLVSGGILSALTIALGALFIWQTLDLYISGTAPGYSGQVYSVERVSERLAVVMPVFFVWIAAIIACYVLWEVFPYDKKRTALKDDCYALNRMKKKMPASAPDGLKNEYARVKREERIILISKLCCLALCIGGAIYCIVYLSIPSNFPKTDVTGEIVRMVQHLLPCVLAALILMCAVNFYESRSAKKQLKDVAKLTAGQKKGEMKFGKVYGFVNGKYFQLGVRIVLGCLAVTFIILGVFNDGMHGVLVKAINICTECIGLG
ncbi:MAG: CD1871A family CXXC motif-containing protein [Candidatus Coproplasma sp.]